MTSKISILASRACIHKEEKQTGNSADRKQRKQADVESNNEGFHSRLGAGRTLRNKRRNGAGDHRSPSTTLPASLQCIYKWDHRRTTFSLTRDVGDCIGCTELYWYQLLRLQVYEDIQDEEVIEESSCYSLSSRILRMSISEKLSVNLKS